MNSFKLGKLLGEDPLKVLEVVQDVTNEIYTDEF